jgi:hypothetical protein
MMGPAPMMRTECMSVRFGIVKPPQIEHGLDCERKEKGERRHDAAERRFNRLLAYINPRATPHAKPTESRRSVLSGKLFLFAWFL